jgi:hypothetical protein
MTLDEVKTSQKATNDVCRNLQKDHPEKNLTAAWEVLPYDSLESFATAAKAWLGERSNLSTKTLNTADWGEIYGYFKMMYGRKPARPERVPEVVEEKPEAEPIKCLAEKLLDGKGVKYITIRTIIDGLTVVRFEIDGKVWNVSQAVQRYL